FMYVPPTAGPTAAPASTPVSASTIRASAKPFAPPRGTSEPWSAVTGSVVVRPPASTAHPWGMGSPLRAALRILPRATWLVARSTTTGVDFVGNAAAMGFVPRKGSWAPGGAIAGGVLLRQ